MTSFIATRFPGEDGRINAPVNIRECQVFLKGSIARSISEDPLPTIQFMGIGTVIWSYPSVEIRDAEYQAILDYCSVTLSSGYIPKK